MPSTQTDHRGRTSTLAALVLLAAIPACVPEAKADIDLTGRWRQGPDSYVHIVQTGTDVAITDEAMPPLVLNGTFDQTTLAVGPPSPTVRMLQYGEGTTLDGFANFGSFGFDHWRFTSCECFDGNAADGDGCDSECRVEPCFTCTPEPSVCTPSAEAAACDDGNDCTTGETCSAGTCGDGSAIVPCVNLTGDWRVLREDVSTGARSEFDTTFTQRDGVVFSDSTIGNVDPATGEMNLVESGGDGLCSHTSSVAGTATLDNLAFSASGSRYVPDRFFCITEPVTQQATRCDATAGCNLPDCTGHPDGTPCESGSACVIEESCQAGVCTAEPKCPLCQTCDSGIDSCETGPRTDCHVTLDPDASRFQIVDKFDGTKDKLGWSWSKGESFDAEEMDPTGPNHLALCVFFGGGDDGAYMAQLSSGAACAKPPCWTGSDGSYKYRNDAAASPFTSISVKSSEDGKSRIQVKGRGEMLNTTSTIPFSFPMLPSAPLPLPFVTQFQSSTGTCFEAEFDSSGVIRNADGFFKANGGAVP